MNIIKIQLLAILLTAQSLPVLAAGQVDYLDVKDGVVLFSTDEAKSAASPPSCMLTNNANKWALSLENDTGRATYSLLLTAMAIKVAIGVETAADCAGSDGFERPSRVWFEVSGIDEPEPTAIIETITTYKPVAFGAEKSSCEIRATLKNTSNQNYLYDPEGYCACRSPSRKVFFSYNSKGNRGYLQCVIEVNTPVFP